MSAIPSASRLQKGQQFTWRGMLATVRTQARDGSWAVMRCVARDGSGEEWGRRFTLPLGESWRPAGEGRAPLARMAHVPDDWLEAYTDLIREREEPDPDAQYARRVLAAVRIHEIEARDGRSYISAGSDDALEELARRRGQ